MTTIENIPKRVNGHKKPKVEDIVKQCVIREECPTHKEYWLCDGRGNRYSPNGEKIKCNKYLPWYVN